MTTETNQIHPPVSGSGSGIETYDTVIDAGNASGSDTDLMYCPETATIYEYKELGSAYTVDGTTVLSTSTGGDTRWVAISGTYSAVAMINKEITIPIGEFHDGIAPPDLIETLISGFGVVNVRRFSAVTTEDLILSIEIPSKAVAANGFRYQVAGIISDTAPSSTVGVSFNIGAYSIGSGEALNGTYSAGIASEKTDLDATWIQYDRFVTGLSTVISPTNGFTAGDRLILNVKRDHTAVNDTYSSDIGVCSLILYWTEVA